MTAKFVIGLDMGTTSVKAVVFGLNGKVAAESEQLTTSYYPQPDWVEQDPEELAVSAAAAIKTAIQQAGILPSQIAAIGFSCAMHSIICVDKNGVPLTRAIIWADGRSSAQAEQLMGENGLSIYARTGTPIHPMSPFVKLKWMNESGYEPYRKAAYFLSVKEYVIQKWYGKRVVDYSMASATGMFNGNTLEWDEEALSAVNVKKEQLSEVVPPTEVLSGMKQEIADEIGIPADLPLVIGAADGQLANLGIGAILPGEVTVTVGTSGAVRQWAKGFQVNEKHETFCYMFTGDTSIIGGPTNNGGIALEWLKKLINYDGTYDELTAEAGKVAPGANGILFLPYINGERAPLWNQQAKGNFFGLSITHQKEHLVRAVLEGITFNLYQIGQALERLAGESKKIYVNGGLARSPLWLQMMADVFGKDIYVSESHHSAAWGAAWTALVAVGEVDSFEDIKQNVPMGAVTKPDPHAHLIYQDVYKKYARLVNDLSKYF
ncbi:gluconate kinase [Bacillus aerolatus]|uniref:Gluconate kinase n=1 Tax=Bacillus aerolatus TaxID=2653354 RepID=A0A6I1FPM5_9BACI|nr:gluconokinase [Bacillus aerolatus]KAB7709181.1 gluconate kinase [Bacillus aerolatus]